MKKKATIGIDLGGTKIAFGLITSDGEILEKKIIPTESSKGVDYIKQNIVTNVNEFLKEKNISISGIGIGVAGQVDLNGQIIFLPNLNWKNIPLKRDLEESLHLPVAITNDVRAAAWGEWLFGGGKGSHNMVLIFVGTGIGSGIVIDGKMINGATNTFGEIGHMTIDIEGSLCTCGNTGCWETLASGWGIAAKTKREVEKNPKDAKKLLERVQNKIDHITTKKIIELAKDGDPYCQKIVKEMAHALGVGMVNIVNTFNPEKVILGGGIIAGRPEFINEIKDLVRQRALPLPSSKVEFIRAKIEEDAGMVGAAAYALQLFNKKAHEPPVIL